MAMDLKGRVALVTGGASGIGAATVALLRARGARVASVDVQSGPGEADLELSCDVRDPAEIDATLARVTRELGGLDLALVNAGVSGGNTSLLEISLEDWDRVIDVNLRGAMLCMQRAARAIVAAGRGGAIVATSSISGFLADRPFPQYSVSKSGLSQLVRVAARELGPRGVRVNAIAPGVTVTGLMSGSTEGAFGSDYRDLMVERTPLGRLGQPDDIAEAVVALFELEWVTGHVLVCDGGISLYSPIDGS